MKKMLMILVVLSYAAMADAPSVLEQFNEAIKRIAMRESGNKDIGLHDDGVSIGKHGVTIKYACRQLLKLKWIKRLPTVKELSDPKTNEEYARLYLFAMIDMYQGKDGVIDIKKAVGRYHGGTQREMDEYVKAVYALELP